MEIFGRSVLGNCLIFQSWKLKKNKTNDPAKDNKLKNNFDKLNKEKVIIKNKAIIVRQKVIKQINLKLSLNPNLKVLIKTAVFTGPGIKPLIIPKIKASNKIFKISNIILIYHNN